MAGTITAVGIADGIIVDTGDGIAAGTIAIGAGIIVAGTVTGDRHISLRQETGPRDTCGGLFSVHAAEIRC
jgi:hypothetical protein